MFDFRQDKWINSKSIQNRLVHAGPKQNLRDSRPHSLRKQKNNGAQKADRFLPGSKRKNHDHVRCLTSRLFRGRCLLIAVVIVVFLLRVKAVEEISLTGSGTQSHCFLKSVNDEILTALALAFDFALLARGLSSSLASSSFFAFPFPLVSASGLSSSSLASSSFFAFFPCVLAAGTCCVGRIHSD
jgi:hypothetical protein